MTLSHKLAITLWLLAGCTFARTLDASDPGPRIYFQGGSPGWVAQGSIWVNPASNGNLYVQVGAYSNANWVSVSGSSLNSSFQDTNIFITTDGNGRETLYSSNISQLKGAIITVGTGSVNTPTYIFTASLVGIVTNSAVVQVYALINGASPQPGAGAGLTNYIHFF